ncbi:MAG: hypothetical protein V7711_17955 [Pseudomonadales bacterium]
MNRRIFKTLLVLLALSPTILHAGQAQQICLVGECSAMTPEFRSMSLRPKTIALLPPLASLATKHVFTSEEMVAEARPLEESLALALENRLSSLKYDVRRITFEELEGDDKLRRLVGDAERRFDEERGKIVSGKIEGVKYRDYTLGTEARQLARYLKVDAVAFTRMQALGQTGAALAIGFGSNGKMHMSMSLVHAKTGDIEGFFGGINTPLFGKSISSILKKPDKHTKKMVKTATKKMPHAEKVLKPEKLDADKVRVAKIYDSEPGDDVVGDLEALLGTPEVEAEAEPDRGE